MAVGRGRGKFNPADIKKDEKVLAGTKVQLPPSESAMDEYLKKIDLFRKPVAKDGSCLFRVVSEQIYQTQAKHPLVRYECIEYMRKHKELFESFIEGSFEHHLYLLRNPKEWGGQVEISALSHLYKCDFIVYQMINTPPQSVTCNGYPKKIKLCYLNGNHYDSVYPLSFKTNAAIAQSLLYDFLLDTVFPVIDRREEEKQNTSQEENNAVGWTEVKTKQKTKIQGDSLSERINDALPDAIKNPKSLWQIKRSLDPNTYRNVELEVWEENKTFQQKNDFDMAMQHQFKPGDLCLATIKESKDVSETVRVKIQEINPDKCRVFSEDYKQQYYVQLADLQPILNGAHDDSYKNLPGYYNKLETDSEFQSQRRRNKNRRTRDDDQRKQHDGNGALRTNDSKRHDQQNRGEKENRSNRRSRKEAERKKEAEKETKPDMKLPIVKSKDTKKVEKIDEPLKPATSPSIVETTAKPAESAAAFWGRMRTKKIPTTNQSEVQTNTNSIITPVVNGFYDSVDDSHDAKTPTTDVHIPFSITSKISTSTSSLPISNQANRRNESPTKNENIIPNTAVSNISTSLTNTVISNTSVKTTITNTKTSTHDQKIITNPTEQTDTKKHVAPVKPAWGHISLPTSIEKLTPAVTPNSLNVSTVHHHPVSTSNTPTSNHVPLQNVKDSRKTPSPSIDTEKFNLTTQASLKISEVHENILASSAKMSSNDIITSDDYDVTHTNEQPITADSLQQLNNELKSRSPNLAVTSLQSCTTDTTVNEVLQVSPVIEEGETLCGKTENTTDNVNFASEQTIISDTHNEEQLEEIPSELGPSNHYIAKMNNDAQDKSGNLKRTKSEVKKKVSFGLTTEIYEKPIEVYTQVQPMDTTPILSHSEPGKIILPPTHRDKLLTDYSAVNMHEISQHHPGEQQQQQTHQIPLQQQQQQQQFLHQQQQPSFINTGMAYYPTTALPNYTTVQPLVPMFINDQVQLPVQLSRDPEGKDLPEDINTLRHFYNLGVQFHLMTIQNNFHHLHQPGILPLPVQHTSPVTVRPLVITSEANANRADVYSPGNVQTNTESLIDLTHHHHHANPSILQSRVPPTHTYNVQLPTQTNHQQHYEEYELPPRLRRTPHINRGGNNNRFFHQRPVTGGRGIMGHGPRPRSDFVWTNK